MCEDENVEAHVRIHLQIAIIHPAIVAVVIGVRRSSAQYAAQLYPYCALSSASGATTCYFRSRAECGSSCMSNPWYIGPGRPWAVHPARPRKGR
jgi:hypothetical protein